MNRPLFVFIALLLSAIFQAFAFGHTMESSSDSIPLYQSVFQYKYFEGDWEKMPERIRSVPYKTGANRLFNLSVADRTIGYAIDYTGNIRIDREDEYIFSLTSDAGSRLEIDNTIAVSNNCDSLYYGFPNPLKSKGIITLTKGIHLIHLLFYTDPLTSEPFLQVEYANGTSKEHGRADHS